MSIDAAPFVGHRDDIITMSLGTVSPNHVRYIRLGSKSKWARHCFDRGEAWFGHHAVPDALCAAGDWKGVSDLLIAGGRTMTKASDFTREIRDFYTLGIDCLWATFAEGKLWWAFLQPEIEWHPNALEDEPSRVRKTVDGWRSTDICGTALYICNLSTKLTQTASYQQTICWVRDQDYLLRKINRIEEPLIAEARAAAEQLSAVAMKLIDRLHWADFEVLAELLLTRSGWQRTSKLGGNQEDVDFVLRNPTMNERAFVQVKSKATQAVLNDLLKRFGVSGMDRFYFVCHSCAPRLNLPSDANLHLWTGRQLADMAVQLGFFDWLVKAAG